MPEHTTRSGPPNGPANTDPALTGSVSDAAATIGHTSTTHADQPLASTERYVLGEEIARGGMGVVYRATDTVFGREVAIKVLQDRFGSLSGAARRFADEAHITGRLQHPSIPPAHDLGTLPDGRPFLAMKLIRGETLGSLLSARRRPSDEHGRYLAVFEAICHALAYAHDHFVIHRDLKPANVMVGKFGEVQVMDWGLAKILSNREKSESDPTETTWKPVSNNLRDSDGSVTQAGSVLGTPAFMPPEQALGAIGKVDAQSDVFGLGAVLAVILTGQPPFAASSAETTRIQAAQGKVDECFTRLDKCGADPDLVALCKRCLAPKKEKRPADAGEVAKAVADLRAAADERARRAELDRVKAEAERTAAELKAAEQRKRRRVQLALAAAVGLLLAIIGAFGWYSDHQATTRHSEAANRERDERERLGRNAVAIVALLHQGEEALRANDSAKAAVALEAAEKRVADGGAEELAGRLAQLRADLAVLRDLDEVDRFRWTFVGTGLPDPRAVATKFRDVLGRFGIDPLANRPDAAVMRVSGSAIRDRLVSALDQVLGAEKSNRVRALLQAVDPDPYRDSVRDAVLGGYLAKLADLGGRPEAANQPPGFVAFLGENQGDSQAALERQRELLGAAIRRSPGNLGLLMALGFTYPINQQKWADERIRWFQAAVGIAPANPAAHTNLGLALQDAGNLSGAEAELREVVRLDAKSAIVHDNLGVLLERKGDLTGAEAEHRKAIQIDQNYANAHDNLGWALQRKGDLNGAEAEHREAIRLDPNYSYAHNNLGWLLEQKGDLAAAVAEYKEALRIDPRHPFALSNLPRVERIRVLLPRLPGVLAGKESPTPAETCEFARLCAVPFNKRHVAAVRLYEMAFDADPALAANQVAGDRYNAACDAALAARGEGVDAPTSPGERATLRAKALGWMRANLALRKKQSSSANASERKDVADQLTQWLEDGDLSALRPGMPRNEMSVKEKTDWDEFWMEVRATIVETRKPLPEVAQPPREWKR